MRKFKRDRKIVYLFLREKKKKKSFRFSKNITIKSSTLESKTGIRSRNLSDIHLTFMI